MPDRYSDPDNGRIRDIFSTHKRVACRTCGEPKGERCRTLKTRRVTDTHAQREADAWGPSMWRDWAGG